MISEERTNTMKSVRPSEDLTKGITGASEYPVRLPSEGNQNNTLKSNSIKGEKGISIQMIDIPTSKPLIGLAVTEADADAHYN